MSYMDTTPQYRAWTRDGFLISTDPSLIPIPALTKAFASEDMYWAKPLPEPAMKKMIDNSLCFGLYASTPLPPRAAEAEQDTTKDRDTFPGSGATSGSESEPSLIGFARAVTDRVTFFYLTDVYVLPVWQGLSLGKWLISCVQDYVEDMPYLRRTMCIVGHAREQGVEFYGKLMKMEPLGDPAMVLTWKGPGCTF